MRTAADPRADGGLAGRRSGKVTAVDASPFVLVALAGVVLVVRGLVQLVRPRAAPTRVRRASDSGAGARIAGGAILALVGYLAAGLWIVLGWLAIGGGLLVMAVGVGFVLAGLARVRSSRARD